MQRVMFKAFFCLFLLFSAQSSLQAQEPSNEPVVKAQIQNDDEARASQEKISKTASLTNKLLNDYRSTLKEIENAKIYNAQLRKIIESQKKDKIQIIENIRNTRHTDKQIVPLMLEMLSALEQFIQLDLPFLKTERQERLKTIKTLMDRADVTVSEKYRKIMEAYHTEVEYGRTIGVYQGLKNIEGKELTVEFLRLGRLSLIYQTLDSSYQAYWSQKEKKWMSIPSKYKKEVKDGFRTAKKEITSGLVTAWIQPPVKELPVLLPQTPEKEQAPPTAEEEGGSE